MASSRVNGTGNRANPDGEAPIDALIRTWERVASDETREEAKGLPADFLEQLDHYASGAPKKPVMRYE